MKCWLENVDRNHFEDM